MKAIQNDYIERCYSGWLGKLIGVRFGAPIEGWTYERIAKVYGEVWDYIVDYKRFAADDDTNGPMFFLRALNDYTHTSEIRSEQIGKTWLNYAPYEHGFYWWGGYGKSTEHTAYLNLRAGIEAPRSGSVAQNGHAIAEQIGGQIFIDTWGLITPDNEKLAAEYAEKAAKVSHGGNGVYGGMFIAAAISSAFSAKNTREIIDRALAVIPEDCEYSRMTRDIITYKDKNTSSNWREAFGYIQANWGYDRYPGSCHIIPNSAVIVMSLLYGDGDFAKTICICNMCGWDTDCNVGNVGTIMGVFTGLGGIPSHFRKPINDAFVASSVIGCLNSMTAPWCIEYISDIAYRIADQALPERWAAFIQPNKKRFHFEMPGSTYGFTIEYDKKDGVFEPYLVNTNQDAATGQHSLKAIAKPINQGESFRIAYKTHFRPSDFHDSRYDPCFSPTVYPGQILRVMAKCPESCEAAINAALYAFDANGGKYLTGEHVAIGNSWRLLEYRIPAGCGICIDEVGVCVSTYDGWNSTLEILLDDFEISGPVDYGIDFSRERTEVWHNFHQEVSQFTYLKGIWRVNDGKLDGLCADFGEAYTGDIIWGDVDFSGTIARITEGHAGLCFRVQGAIRSYCAAVDGKSLLLMKNDNGYAELASVPFEAPLGKNVRLSISCRKNVIMVFADDAKYIEFEDADHPYLTGCIGAAIADGCHALFSDWHVRSY